LKNKKQIELDYEKKNLKIEPNKESKQEKKQDDNDMPQYLNHLTYSKEQVERLRTEVFDEFEYLKKERDELNLPEKWKMLENQFAGKLQADSYRQFNLHRQLTKTKVRTVVGRIMSALFKPDTLFSVFSRPEFATQGGSEVCEKQEDFLDYKIDEVIPLKSPMRKVAKSSVVKGVGVLRALHEIKRENRRREETYKGVLEPLLDPETGEIIREPNSDMPIYDESKNTGLIDFVSTYPDTLHLYPGYIEKLKKGKEINLVIEYTETTYNDPKPVYVEVENFYVRNSVEGYEGLKDTLMIVEREKFNWWELKKEEKLGNFENIDELMYTDGDKKEKAKDYKQREYNILRCTYYFSEKEDDEDEKKIVCWFDEENKIFLGAINYPYYGIASYYIPFYIIDEDLGFYKCGLAEDLTDSNIAENAILNFVLEGALIANTVTPIAPEGSAVDTQLLEKRWVHGMTLNAVPGEVDFLNKYMGRFDIGGLLNLMNYLVKMDDDISGVSSLMTGRADPIDPRAPATKTMALLEQSGESINAYLEVFALSVNITATVLLQMYHQISREDGILYRKSAERSVGGDPFASISRSEIIAKTNIQSQAMAYNFDKLDEKRTTLALHQVLREDPIIKQNPDAVHYLVQSLIKSWSPKWKNNIQKILPPMEEFQKQKLMLGLQAVDAYVQGKIKDAELGGIDPKFDPEELVSSVSQYVQESITPPSKEEVQAREQG